MTDPAIHVSVAARSAAAARQLDWLLGEALGQVPGVAPSPCVGRGRAPWLAAACVLIGLGAVFGTAHWRNANDAATAAPQDQEATPWHDCHGPAALAQVPADVRALRCFDFDDAACGKLARFAALEQLDLGAMDVDAAGTSRSLAITDAGVRSLASLTGLRWLRLAQCHQVHGYGLRALEALPRLEHLDLTYSGVVTEAVERLANLPSLRSLVLSHCMGFHGRALTAITAIPGLQRLELASCTTITAAAAMSLPTMRNLRHLDLRDCQGRFRGQTSAGFGRSGPDVFVDSDDDGMPDRRLAANEQIPDGAATFVDGDGDGLPDLRVDLAPPTSDDIGITDSVVQALAKLPLVTLRLGGCTSLTDAIGPALATMTTLRELDLGGLPKVTGAVLASLPTGLHALGLAGNSQFEAGQLRSLTRLTELVELDLKVALRLRDDDFAAILASKSLRVLSLGDARIASKMGPGPIAAAGMQLGARSLALLRQQPHLHTLRLTDAKWLDPNLMREVAAIPTLNTLDLQGSLLAAGCVLALGTCKSLQRLDLSWARLETPQELAALAALPLRNLGLLRTKCAADEVRALAKAHWPECEVVLPNGALFRAR
jgi:hypothetical protein